jgi:hypothetical protein
VLEFARREVPLRVDARPDPEILIKRLDLGLLTVGH